MEQKLTTAEIEQMIAGISDEQTKQALQHIFGNLNNAYEQKLQVLEEKINQKWLQTSVPVIDVQLLETAIAPTNYYPINEQVKVDHKQALKDLNNRIKDQETDTRYYVTGFWMGSYEELQKVLENQRFMATVTFEDGSTEKLQYSLIQNTQLTRNQELLTELFKAYELSNLVIDNRYEYFCIDLFFEQPVTQVIQGIEVDFEQQNLPVSTSKNVYWNVAFKSSYTNNVTETQETKDYTYQVPTNTELYFYPVCEQWGNWYQQELKAERWYFERTETQLKIQIPKKLELDPSEKNWLWEVQQDVPVAVKNRQLHVSRWPQRLLTQADIIRCVRSLTEIQIEKIAKNTSNVPDGYQEIKQYHRPPQPSIYDRRKKTQLAVVFKNGDLAENEQQAQIRFVLLILEQYYPEINWQGWQKV